MTGVQTCALPISRIPKRGLLAVGLVWKGNPGYPRDHLRSMPFRELCPLFDMPAVAFHSLQLGPGAKEIDDMGYGGFVADLTPFATNWRATAQLVEALDIVVSVDTAVAHLAGALGKPVVMMATNASDWRWPRKGEKTPWYDSMICLRQPFQGQWAPVVARVREILEERRGELKEAA